MNIYCRGNYGYGVTSQCLLCNIMLSNCESIVLLICVYHLIRYNHYYGVSTMSFFVILCSLIENLVLLILFYHHIRYSTSLRYLDHVHFMLLIPIKLLKKCPCSLSLLVNMYLPNTYGEIMIGFIMCHSHVSFVIL